MFYIHISSSGACLLLFRSPPADRPVPGIEIERVFVTVAPGLTRFDGSDKRVARIHIMFPGVSVPGRVTTTHLAAREAHPQVNPSVTGINALFAYPGIGVGYLDLVQMTAFHGLRIDYDSSSKERVLLSVSPAMLSSASCRPA